MEWANWIRDKQKTKQKTHRKYKYVLLLIYIFLEPLSRTIQLQKTKTITKMFY